MRADRARRGCPVWVPVLVLAVLGLSLTLPRLGDSGLWDPWEPVYAQTAREMAQRGDWVVPYHRGEPRVNRPPVTYWLIGASQAAFGVSEFAARLPSALLAVLCPLALCLAFVARGRPLEGFLCGAALLSSPQWLFLGRSATLSMPLAAWLGLLLALALGWPGLETARARRLGVVAVVLCLALAALTNWPRGLLLPAWAVLGWAALERPRAGTAALVLVAGMYHAGQLSYWPGLTLGAFALAVGLALGFLVAWCGVPVRVVLLMGAGVGLLVAPWFLAVAQVPGELKLMNYKYALNLGESPGDHTGPYADVLRTLVLGGLPWAAAALAGLIQAFRRNDGVARILGGTLIGGLLFFTLAESRMGHFTSVLQPAVCGLAAVGLAALARRRDWMVVPVALALTVMTYLAWEGPERILETVTVRRGLGEFDPAPWVLAAAGAWALAVGIAWWRGSLRLAVAAVLPAALLSGALAIGVVPALSGQKSARGLWESYVADRRGNEPLALVGPSMASIFYYSDNSIVRIDDERQLGGFLGAVGPRYLIVADSMLDGIEGLPPEERSRFEVVGAREAGHPTHTLLRFTPGPAEPVASPGGRPPGPD